jgi:AraC-like DNA-binding protein
LPARYLARRVAAVLPEIADALIPSAAFSGPGILDAMQDHSGTTDVNGTTPTDPRTHGDDMRRAQQAWQLRVGGLTWDQVADSCGYANKQNAARAVRRHLGAIPQPDREATWLLWHERLELLWQRALRDVEDGKPGAMRAAVSLAQRVAAMQGLDSPSEHRVTVDRQPGDLHIIAVVQGGGLPTIAERAAYNISAEEIRAIRRDAGLTEDDGLEELLEAEWE